MKMIEISEFFENFTNRILEFLKILLIEFRKFHMYIFEKFY